MRTVLRLVNVPSDEHLENVKAEMRRLGPPTVRVVDYRNCYMAIEGSHRLWAAAELGIAPFLKVLASDALIQVDSHLETDGLPAGTACTAGELAAMCYSCSNPKLTVNADRTLTLPMTKREEE